jgi:hypothetical protein
MESSAGARMVQTISYLMVSSRVGFRVGTNSAHCLTITGVTSSQCRTPLMSHFEYVTMTDVTPRVCHDH